jgi:Flp pilus assembly protein TadG
MQSSGIHGAQFVTRRFFGRVSDEGTALIETALTLPIMLLLLTGAVEFARASYTAIEVSNAANAGAQYGAQSATKAADTTGIQTAAVADAPDITLATPTSSISCTCSDGTTPSSCAAGCASSSATLERILTVQTQTTYTPMIHVAGFANSFTLNGVAVRKVFQ